MRLVAAQVFVDEADNGVRDDAGEAEREIERAAPERLCST